MTTHLQGIWTLPPEFLVASDATMVVGDLDAFSAYIETGQAFEDWQACCQAAAREREAFFTANQHLWHHIIHMASET